MSRKKLFPGCILHAAQKNCLALKECDEDMYPNLYVLLKICCTIPATSCECERSASALRRLHTFNRASMTQERLSSLVWKAKWCKIQETKLASRSTNLLSRSREISINLNKINSHSTDFLSRSRHLESSSTK